MRRFYFFSVHSFTLVTFFILVSLAHPAPSASASASRPPAFPTSPTSTASITPSTPPRPEIVGWISAPQVRGTFDLLLSCLTTLFLCAWTAYHPNVHSGARSMWLQTAHRAIWMCIAVFLPEVVLFCAWEQWWAARWLRGELGALVGRGVRIFAVDEGKDPAEKPLEGEVESGGDGGGENDANDSETVSRFASQPREERGIVEEEECVVCSCERKNSISSTSTSSGSSLGLSTLFNPSQTSPPSDESTSSTHQPEPQYTYKTTAQALQEQKDLKKAKKAQKPQIKKRLKENQASGKQIWNTQQSFFALSGGFAIPTSSFSPHARLTLTPHGLLFLAKLGLLPTEEPEVVSDKSKADYVAKVLVCLQAGWFFVQCIGRLVEKLPLTLLEVHVLTHVFCAFGMYLLWIQKPYDVGSPVLCKDERVVDLAALWGLHVESNPDNRTHGDQTQCAQLHQIHPTQVQTAHTKFYPPSSHRRYLGLFIRWADDRIKTKRLSTRKTPPPTPKALEQLRRANRALAYLKSRNMHFTWKSKATVYLKDDDEGFDPKDPTYHWEQHTSVDLDADYVVPLRSNLVLDGLTRLQSDERRQDQVLLSVKTYAVMSALYGGLHLAAWNSRFPTSVEMWLWRASGLVMVAAPVLSLIGVLGFALFRVEEKGKKRAGKMEGGKGWRTLVRGLLRAVSWFVGLLGSLAWCFGLVTAACTWVMYLFARSYVFGESFAALRAQERDVYRTVEWADFIPHAG